MERTRLIGCFTQALGLGADEVVPELAYNSIKAWDSVGHMALVAEIESVFDIMLDTDDILDMSTVAKAFDIVARYGVNWDAA
jgi:acyl carrier protein